MKKRGADKETCRIRYVSVPAGTGEDKLAWLGSSRATTLLWQDIAPREGYWIDNPKTEFGDALPIATKSTKKTKLAGQERAIFKLFSLGVVTNRDDWVYGYSDHDVETKVKHLLAVYNLELNKNRAAQSGGIKWTRLVKQLLKKKVKIRFSQELISNCMYRPFHVRRLYFSKQINEMQYRLGEMFGSKGQRQVSTIVWSDPTSQKPFMCLAVDGLFDLHMVGAASGAVGAARTITSTRGESDNITDWALDQFAAYYGEKALITKDDIFAYVYGVLHDPIYRETYKLNLKREFPRIPFYSSFKRWRDWGQFLLALHIGYESAEPFPLVRTDVPDEKVRASGQTPRVILNADRDNGIIVLDSETQLSGVPVKAWDYKLGDRLAIEWVLDQHKEKAPRDPIIRDRFNTYRFADHKEQVIDLLTRVVTVSVETVNVVEEMRKTAR